MIKQDVKKKLGSLKRTPVSASQEEWVRLEPLAGSRPLPLLARPAIDGMHFEEWLRSSRPRLDKLLLENGGVLFRGFPLDSVERFEQLAASVSGELLDYRYRSTPRTQVSGRIFTSTEYPADQWIPAHNEMSYTDEWPRKIWFYCVTPAQSGGETPIYDSRRVFQRIDPAVRRRFAEKRVMYVRNYGAGLDLDWQSVFQTSDRSEVEAFCRERDIACEWKPDGGLRTRQVCQAVIRHPDTREEVWFNQAHLFHVSSLAPELQETLRAQFSEEDLPRNTLYGDGTPIEASALAEIRGAYQEEQILFPWQAGDVLLLDNILVAHGRAPFSGPRRVVVAMAEACREDQAD